MLVKFSPHNIHETYIDQKSAAVSAFWKLLIGLIDQLLILVSRP